MECASRLISCYLGRACVAEASCFSQSAKQRVDVHPVQRSNILCSMTNCDICLIHCRNLTMDNMGSFWRSWWPSRRLY